MRRFALFKDCMHSHPRIVILLGAPGSGKGTQAALIQERLHLPHISTGDILRNQIKQKTDLGAKAKEFIDKGHLVPDLLILDMIFKRLQEPDCSKGYILDGVPRTIPQAESLETFFPSPPIAINFFLPKELIIERLSLRTSCSQCGQPYHLAYSPPTQPGICDRCQGILIQRPDDSKEVVLKRLEVYSLQTEPLLEFYTQRKILHTIDCTKKNKEQIYSELVGFFD